MIIDYTASIVTGGGLRARIENTCVFYSEDCKPYFDDILSKRGKAFADSACGFLLLDSLLQKHKIDRLTLAITLDENGRPRTNRDDLDFSISHSEGCALCAIALGEHAGIGADIQRKRSYSLEKMRELAPAFMSDSELAKFNEPPKEYRSDELKITPPHMLAPSKHFENLLIKEHYVSERPGMFFTAWTRRESYVKRMGKDIFDHLKNADLSGEYFREGIIFACGEQYYYSINLPPEAAEEASEEARE